MNPIKPICALLLICGMTLSINGLAQERNNFRQSTAKFEFKHTTKGDTLHMLYCVMSVSDIYDFEKILLSYNDKTKQYFTKNLLTSKSEEYSIDGRYIVFKISETLDDPFVVIEGVDRSGRKYDINERNAKGKIIDSRQEQERWKKSVSRIDSMDYVRNFDGVYVGGDGMPRFHDKNGKVYIINKDHIYAE